MNSQDNLKKISPVTMADFDGNYSCSFAAEIQTAYFDKSTKTLHPVIVYFRDKETDEVKNKSKVIASKETHTATTVITIMKRCPNEVPYCHMIHDMADSKTSRLEFQEFFNSGKIVPGFQAA
jgi:hypothetical protein